MAYTEAQERHYQELELPKIEAFHAANPLRWTVDSAIASETNSEVENDFIVDSKGPAVLGKKFLDVTNVWQLNPELPAQEKLTSKNLIYLDEIKWVMNNIKKSLIEVAKNNDSNAITILTMPIKDYLADVKFADQSIDEYLEVIKQNTLDDQEYQYIVDIVNKGIIHIDSFRQKLLSYIETNEPIPQDMTQPHHRTRKHPMSPR